MGATCACPARLPSSTTCMARDHHRQCPLLNTPTPAHQAMSLMTKRAVWVRVTLAQRRPVLLPGVYHCMLKIQTSCSSLAQKPPQSHWDNIWSLAQTLTLCGTCHRCPQLLSHYPSQTLGPSLPLLQTHCKSSFSLCPLTPFLIGPHPWAPWALEEGPGISASRSMDRALFLVLPCMGSHRLGVPFLLAPRLVGCYLCYWEGLIHVFLFWGCITYLLM